MTFVDALIPTTRGVRRVQAEPITIGAHACLVHAFQGAFRQERRAWHDRQQPWRLPPEGYTFTIADARTGYAIAYGRDRRQALAAAARRLDAADPRRLAASVDEAVAALRSRGGDAAFIAEWGAVEAAARTAPPAGTRAP